MSGAIAVAEIFFRWELLLRLELKFPASPTAQLEKLISEGGEHHGRLRIADLYNIAAFALPKNSTIPSRTATSCRSASILTMVRPTGQKNQDEKLVRPNRILPCGYLSSERFAIDTLFSAVSEVPNR